MRPTLHPGDRLLVDRQAFRNRSPRVGEIVVVVDPESPARWLVKRVRAVGPGTFWRTSEGLVPVGKPTLITDPAHPPDAVEMVALGPGAIWVQGDAPDVSRDSRRFGPVRPAGVVGKVFRCYAPPARRRDF
jgi:signal peptidase I